MGRPPKFSREQLKTAALALVDAEGLGALSMRTLARALGTGPMTLYNHVTDREDLDLLVLDAVMAEIRLPDPRPDDWRDDIRAVAVAVWRVVRAHPHVVPLIAVRRSRSPVMVEVAEALLGALSRSGRTGHDLLIAFRALTALVMGFAQAELAGPLALQAGETAEAVIARFRSLPPERYPRLLEIADAAATSDAETEFRRGLDLLLTGLAGS